MKNGQCPKCNSTEVYRGAPSTLVAGEGLVHITAIARNTGINIMVSPYICINCGYVEMYVADMSKEKVFNLKEDPKNWQKIG